eukprot:CAMPEP_0194509950 /NCGR_PEP_ID=MMETSP0253-20130528/41216_1 /TAXON_ID=2966 /ORGANISM="Noctiluca scintillans" /LENGTH=168 /DNA_ID=CAMNT_0039353157 /DNA_START=98 /DNA_END=604 /DNA_ORIENTATION=+
MQGRDDDGTLKQCTPDTHRAETSGRAASRGTCSSEASVFLACQSLDHSSRIVSFELAKLGLQTLLLFDEPQRLDVPDGGTTRLHSLEIVYHSHCGSCGLGKHLVLPWLHMCTQGDTFHVDDGDRAPHRLNHVNGALVRPRHLDVDLVREWEVVDIEDGDATCDLRHAA